MLHDLESEKRKKEEEEAASTSASTPLKESPEDTEQSHTIEQSLPCAASAPTTPKANITISPGAESVMTVSDLEFSFASPIPETLRQDTSMIASDTEKDDEYSMIITVSAAIQAVSEAKWFIELYMMHNMDKAKKNKKDKWEIQSNIRPISEIMHKIKNHPA